MIDPIEAGFTVTPSDTEDLEHYTRAVYVGTTGDLKVELTTGNTITFVNVQDGTLLPIQVRKVFSTGTDATNILGLY